MKNKKAIILLTFLIILVTLVACKPKELPKYSNVIETVPNHILDIVETVKDQSGVYIFDSKKFGTDPNTYIAITHSDKEKTMVTIGEIEYGDDDQLIVTLIETTASTDREFSIIKIENYTGKITIESQQNYETLITNDLYFSSEGSIHALSESEVTIGVNSFPIVLNISQRANTQIEENNISTNDNVIFEYSINDTLELIDIQKILNQGELEGIFIGYIDSHTVEILVGQEHLSYQVSDEVAHQINQKDIEYNQEIIFNFIEFASGQKVLTEIK
jgi:hypothetical protein